MKRIFVGFVLMVVSVVVYAQQLSYLSFDQLSVRPNAAVVNCMLQDSTGLMWIGSDKGLYSYDGSFIQRHFGYADSSNTHIYCMVQSNRKLFMGTDNGILIYDTFYDRYVSVPIQFPSDIRCLLLQKNKLWIGSLNGLFCYDILSQQLIHFDDSLYTGLLNHTIYALLESGKGKIYIGTYDGLYKYIHETNHFERLKLPVQSERNNQFINSLLEDTIRHCIWIGTERKLLQYFPDTGEFINVNGLQDNSVKSLALDRKSNLLIGTDNGLYILNPATRYLRHIIHDSRNNKSLSNNIIWNIYVDREFNVWLGTDLGISLSRNSAHYQLVPIDQITGIGEGNRFYNLFKDSYGDFWLGGTNGLIMVSASSTKNKVRWFRMGDINYPLSHNRIRDIYEDRDRDLWLATDGGVNLYSRKKSQFTHYNIIDRTGKRNANWVYDIFEGPSENLWIATCLGGVFKVDKQKLLNSDQDTPFVAGQNFSEKDGLLGDFVSQIVPGKNGKYAWALIYNKGINQIELATGNITSLAIGKKSDNFVPNYILVDLQNNLWIGGSGRLMKYDRHSGKVKYIDLVPSGHVEILSMAEENRFLWVCTTKGVFCLNKKTLQVTFKNPLYQTYTSSYYDSSDSLMFLGGVDQMIYFSPFVPTMSQQKHQFLLTSLLVNNENYKKVFPKSKSIRYLKQLNLSYEQNNLSISFSDFCYSNFGRETYYYKLEGFDESWKSSSDNPQKISYARLHYGDYHLLVGYQNPNGKIENIQQVFSFVIRPPWYYTGLAKMIYLILFIGLVFWTITFFNVRNHLKIERLEREKLVELSDLKIRFFADVSHEFKTPLSLIIGPVSRLIAEIKGETEHRELELIRRNALRLNSLIHQALDFNRMDHNLSTELLVSKIEFVDFSHSLFDNFCENFKNRNLSFSFSSNLPVFYVEADQVKIESVLTNLLSNACKFSGQGGHIRMKLDCSNEEQYVEVTIWDEGIGISEEDLPHVTERFFQGKQNSRKTEGTGLGLYLVKNYLDLHHSHLIMESNETKGTKVSFKLPASEGSVTSNLDNEISADHELKGQVKIMIVEDNREIADFISVVLGNSYECKIAENGKEGLELCQSFHPDLIIADIMMPIMNGLEMCAQIRKMTVFSTLPIILLTAKDDHQTELESIQLNIDAFMSKPFDIQILVSRIRQLLAKKKELEKKVHLEALTQLRDDEDKLSQDEEMLSEITRIIEEKLDDPDFNVEVLSQECGWHKKQIYRKLKQLTGMSTVEYIKSIRMKKAAMYFEQRKFTVAEVMYMVGFSSSSYFSKCFHAEFGMTPKQFLDKKG